MKTKMSRLALTLGALVFAGGAAAQTSTEIAVTASITATCSIGNGTSIALGALALITEDGAQASEDSVADSTFSAICTNGTTFPKFSYASLNENEGAFRLIGANTEAFLVYTLHQNDDADGDEVVHDVETEHPDFAANGEAHTLPIAVKVTAAEKVGKLAQAYSDTITVSVSFGEE